MLFHQCLSLFFDRVGLYRLAAFYPHRGLDSLGDLLVQVGADLHRLLPKTTRQSGEFCCCKLYQFSVHGDHAASSSGLSQSCAKADSAIKAGSCVASGSSQVSKARPGLMVWPDSTECKCPVLSIVTSMVVSMMHPPEIAAAQSNKIHHSRRPCMLNIERVCAVGKSYSSYLAAISGQHRNTFPFYATCLS